MSSLAAARADNFYYDPGWTPAAGSLNTYHGTHALGKRASKLKSQGILVIRCVCHSRRAAWLPVGDSFGQGEARWRSLLRRCARLCVLTPPLCLCSFEMPFNVWCTGCRHLIAKGTCVQCAREWRSVALHVGSHFLSRRALQRGQEVHRKLLHHQNMELHHAGALLRHRGPAPWRPVNGDWH
jgi:hypothetical protein